MFTLSRLKYWVASMQDNTPTEPPEDLRAAARQLQEAEITVDEFLALCAAAALAALPEKRYNDHFDLKKMTPWRRMKARMLVKGAGQAISAAQANIRQVFGGEQ